jgi:hypothetical protein
MWNISDKSRPSSTDTGGSNMTEGTVVVAVDWLPMHGRAWIRYPDADVVAVSAHLNDVGRGMALAEAGLT